MGVRAAGRHRGDMRAALLVIGPLAIAGSLFLGHGLLLAAGLVLSAAGLAWRPAPRE